MDSALEARELLAFRAISCFVLDTAELYRRQQRSLALYERLVEKTNFAHARPIRKHVSVVTTFCAANRDAIAQKDTGLMVCDKFKYSERVYIDVKKLLESADSDNATKIWQHLLTIAAIVDPNSGALDKLKALEEGTKAEEEIGIADELLGSRSGSREDDLLRDIITKVEETVGGGSNRPADPADAMKSMMTSGALTGLMASMTQGMEKGELDFGKLMGSINGMMSNIGGDSLPPEVSRMQKSLGEMVEAVESLQKGKKKE